MTTNQTIDGVRKLAEQACGTSPDSPAYRRFIAAMNPTLLLDLTAPAAQPRGEPFAVREFVANPVPDDQIGDDWTKGYEECKRRIGLMLVAPASTK